MEVKKVVTRFAPSPTGYMHVGNLRTGLYAWLWARKNNGTFILRIEDTDKKREVEGSIEHIMRSLKWIGMDWDQGPDIGGSLEPYIQSQRLDLYKSYGEKLIKKGLAYADPYSQEELEAWRREAEVLKRPFLYREHRPEGLPAWDGSRPLRFKVPEIKRFTWVDAVWGELSAGPEALDDFILIKSDGYPTYNFAHIVDDIEMGITHVTRGQEFISSTPKYLSLYEALEVQPPIFVTTPPVMSIEGKKKLGKRDGAKDVLEYEKEGYLPQAMMNFLALMGWNPGGEQEVFTKDELTSLFDISKIHPAGAKIGDDKLGWLNKEHLKKLSPEEIEKNILAWMPEEMRTDPLATKLVPIIFERISKWGDVKELIGAGELDLFFKLPEYDKTKLIFKDTPSEKIIQNLKVAITALENLPDDQFNVENVKNTLMQIAVMLPSKGEVLHPVRVALSGKDKSPDPFTIASILGKNETISRLQNAIQN
ncbi:MAG: glutamate--tRNA ligase [Candidatus Paceibacterota bacterium]